MPSRCPGVVPRRLTQPPGPRQTNRKWSGCRPSELFDATVESTVKEDGVQIRDTLTDYARGAQLLIVATDNDREVRPRLRRPPLWAHSPASRRARPSALKSSTSAAG